MNQTMMDSEMASDLCSLGINIDVLKDAMSNDVGAITMLLDIFIEDHSKDSHLIRQSLRANCLTEARIAVHSLKGVAGSIGATGLRDVARDLEQTLKAEQKPSEQSIRALEHQLIQAVTSSKYHIRALNGSE